jgi:MSHA biogenesis protein MshQ
MKAGNPFSLTVTAFNGAATPAVTPNFGKEATPEKVTLTSTANMPDLPGAVAGNLICNATQPGTTTCTTGAGVATVADVSGAGAVNARLLYDEAGIMTLGARLASGNYLGSGLKEITIPSSGNIGRFIPDHFTVATDPDSPIIARSDFVQNVTTVSAPSGAGATIISVATTTGFNAGDKVRIPGAGAGGNAYTGTITAVGASTLTLSTAIGTALVGDGSETVIDEWGTYAGEIMDAQFTLNAIEFGGSPTNNYQGAYAKLNPVAAGNPLALGAVDTVGPTFNVALSTALTATGSFVNGSATITAPVAVVRGATAIAPYTSLKIGIAPTDSDGIKMGSFDLGVTSATADHASIMDPLVQASTEVRYGRLKLSNAVGSEKASLQIPLQAQYWSGSSWVLNANDSQTQIPATSVALSNYRDKSTPPTPNWTTTATGLGTLSAGQGVITLSAPTPAGGTGSVDLAINLGIATTDASCLTSHPVMTAPALSLAYLRGPWCAAASTFTADPSATATFGVYTPETRKAVHIRELF